MANFFLTDTTPSQSNYKSALPDFIFLPLNIGRSIPRQSATQNNFIQPPSNSVNLTDWINYQIEEGNINAGTGTTDGNGIYSGNGVIPNNTIARIGNSFGISPVGTTNEYNLILTPTSSQLGVGVASSTYSYRLTLTETTATFTDDIASGGLKYAADYSAQFVPLSLVTKQYVDSVAGSNGIYSGSDIVPSSVIASLTNSFKFNPNLSANSYFTASPTLVELTSIVSGNYRHKLSLTNTDAIFTDNSNTGGLKYAANYSANYSLRSLIDLGYLNQVLDGRKWKQSVVVATTANITLSGEQTIDGVLTSNSRILVKDQTDETQNGIYLSSAGAWVRTSDMNEGFELEAAAVSVEQGTINGNEQWFQQTDPVTLGTDNIIWVPIGSGVYTADGLGIEVFANEFSLELDGATLSKSSAGLKVANAGITEVQLNSSVAGAGLVGGAGTPLAVGAGTGITVSANDVSVTGFIGSPWQIPSILTGSFTVASAGAFTQNVSVSPYTGNNIMVQLRDSTNAVIGAAINTTVSGGNITISGFAPSSSYLIKYILIAV